MRMRVAGGSATVLVLVTAGWIVRAQQRQGQAPPSGQQQAQSSPQVTDNRTTKEQVERWMTELSNWGRWGKDDELGAVNLITPKKRRQAAALVKTGTSVSLAHDVLTEKGGEAPNPYVLNVIPRDPVAVERQDFSFHGRSLTHLDALCHGAYRGKTYNGFDFHELVTEKGGCAKVGIGRLKDGLVTRGVLIDIPRLKGVPYLEAGTHVYREDIEAWEKRAGVKVSAGDVLLLRTGRWALRAKIGPFINLSGFDASFLPFLKERDVALLGSDGTQDVGTVAGFDSPNNVVHRVAIVVLGIHLFDNLDLEALAETAAQLNRWEFMFVASPVRVANGTGGPINPIAVF